MGLYHLLTVALICMLRNCQAFHSLHYRSVSTTKDYHVRKIKPSHVRSPSTLFLKEEKEIGDFGASSSKSNIITLASTITASIVLLAKFGVLGPYTDELIARDLGAAVTCTVLAYIFVKSITWLANNDKLQARDSRKIIHMLSAPLFMLLWPLFSNVWGARLFAALTPLLQGINLYLAGSKKGGQEGQELSNTISRSGDEKEALQGPFIYVIILFSAIILGFTDSLTPMVALSTMAFGDGMADIVGRRLGKNNKWFFSTSKSVAGTTAFILAATFASFVLAYWFQYTGLLTIDISAIKLVQRIFFISAISSVVELLPVLDDNWSVPITAAMLASIIL